jgi:hypothetical protein
MEKALENMDPSEYARFKYAKNKPTEFNEDIMKKITDYAT